MIIAPAKRRYQVARVRNRVLHRGLVQLRRWSRNEFFGGGWILGPVEDGHHSFVLPGRSGPAWGPEHEAYALELLASGMPKTIEGTR